MRILRSIAAAGLLVALMPPASAAVEQVRIPGRFFSPARIAVFAGDTVRWTNADNERHTVTASTQSRGQGESFDSSPDCPGIVLNDCLKHGQTFSHTFNTVGVFVYYCKRHGSDNPFPNCGMCGRVGVVRRGSGGTPTTPGTASPTPGTSGSPSRSPSGSGSPSPSSSASGGSTLAGGPGSGGSSGTRTIAIAALVVALLSGSGYLVYRTMIRR